MDDFDDAEKKGDTQLQKKPAQWLLGTAQGGDGTSRRKIAIADRVLSDLPGIPFESRTSRVTSVEGEIREGFLVKEPF